MKKEKEILRKQLELLAEQSKEATDKELCELSDAMSDIYTSLCRPANGAAVLIGIFVTNAYFVVGFLVHVKKLFRGET